MTAKRIVEITLPPQDFSVPVPRPARQETKEVFTAILYGDTHVPFHDQRVIDVIMRIAGDLDPDVIVNVGDLLDCRTISRFDKDPYNGTGLQDEIDLAKVHLHQMAQVAPRARKILLSGNHEWRLQKVIWGMHGAEGELAQLTMFRETMVWPVLLGLSQMGWEHREYNGQHRMEVVMPLLLTHGSTVRKHSGASARGEYERFGTSGASGHVHRAGLYYHRDHSGPHVWIEVPCSCLLDPEYCVNPDWQQGCMVVTYSADGEVFGVEPVIVHEGIAMFRGRIYHA